MSAAPVVPVPSRVPVSVAVRGLLTILGAGDPEDFIHLYGRTRTGIDRGRHGLVRVRDCGASRLPPFLLAALEENIWGISARLPVCRADQVPKSLAAISATWPVPAVPERVRIAGKERDGAMLIFDAAGLSAAIERAMTAPWGPPSMVLDYGVSVTALWRLAEPIRFRYQDDVARAYLLQRTVAAVLGADVPEADGSLGDCLIPVPGTLLREGPAYKKFHVEAVHLDTERRIELRRVEAAIEGGKA